jgi:C4-dicarboxylate-binding protein DctP
MNAARYNALPEDVKHAIAAASDEVQAWSVDESKRGDEQSLEFLKSKVQVHVLTPEERNNWRQALAPVTQSWQQRASKEERDVYEWVRSLR